jgi:hypothetical protein
MAQTLSLYTSALKEILLPYIQDNFPKQTILLDQMKRDAGQQFINDEFLFPVRASRHGGVANLANDGNSLVTSSGARTSRGTIEPKRVTGAFEISDMVIRASKTSQGAVESALGFQSDSLVTDFARHVNRQLYSDGVGIVGQVLGSVADDHVSVIYPNASLDDGRSIDWYGTINGDISAVKYFHRDQNLGIGTGGAAAGVVGTVTGTSIQFTTGTVASAANDAIYILDGSDAGAGTSEIQGIRAALSSTTGTSTYAGLARTTTGWLPQFGSTSEALTLARMESSYLKAREYSQTGDKYAIFVNVSLFQKYGDILTAMRRHVNQTDLLGGWTGLEFAAGAGKVGVFLDYEVPDGEILIINMDTWALAQIDDIDWLAGTDGNILRVKGSTLYEAVMVFYANALCLAPAANGRETQKTN